MFVAYPNVKVVMTFARYFSLTNDRYIYDNPVHLVPELDGLRIVGHYSHEFLQRVPGSEIKYIKNTRLSY